MVLDQYKNLIRYLGFLPKENTSGKFQKKYAGCNEYSIEIDFENERINYGDLIQSYSSTTQNFTQSENWVVLECVDRLLTKGYQPQNIILEKTWAAGHQHSGRLDICVTRDDGSEYLLIECKTYGKEFDREFARMKSNGGQLFTYFKFSNKADVIVLYASELINDKIVYRNEIVKIEDDYRTGDVKDFYERWNKLTKDNGVFDNWVRPYNFESKALTPENLEEIKPEDSSLIFNQFLEILRHNVVSDKPNAFNKIFTLFLCKIFDEKNTKPNEELAFQWFYTPYKYEGISYPPDNHISFQKRLTDLYKKGMKEFLEKEVTDISDADFEKKYSDINEETRKKILDDLTDVRLKKNNEFAIKEVFDDDSFEENAKVVKEVVELLQGYKIRYATKQQYLSDFFELLLTTGLKQESGQFFTPVPVAQFIIKSLPVDRIVNDKLQKGVNNELLPHIIDYAAGSGHFITESMHELQQLLENFDSSQFYGNAKRFIEKAQSYPYDWAYDYVYGIEKDYRLVKVGKVGCYLHGDGLAQVIHSDGLGNFSKTKDYKGLLARSGKDFPKENKQFDILVSNPPYSVAAFKSNASKFYGKDDFDLHGSLTDSSSEIECLFVERAKQLLADGGIAGIILPSSILSNAGIYTKAREIILQYFEIVAITELGSNTFMATGTNTVVLFLRRRNNYDGINLKRAVEKFFADFQDVTLNGIEKPAHKYIAHVWEGISFDDYISLIQKQPSESIQQHELFKEYNKKIKARNEQEKSANIVALELEKLFYFILAYPQKIVLVKSGEKDAEKRFLGYEFSSRRGSEGIHPIQRSKTIDECTSLYDAHSFENPEKASTYIYKNFKGEHDFEIHESLRKNIFQIDLVDMMTFDRVDFEKNISLVVKKKVHFESQFQSVRIAEIIADLQSGKRPKGGVGEYNDGIPSIGGEHIGLNGKVVLENMKFVPHEYFENAQKGILTDNDILICKDGALTGKVAFFKQTEFPYSKGMINEHVFALKSQSYITQKYLFSLLFSLKGQQLLKSNISGQAQGGLNRENLLNIRFPFPPQKIQEKIIAEIDDLEKREISLKQQTGDVKDQIKNIVKNLEQYPYCSLGEISENFDNKRKPVTKGYRVGGEIPYYGASGIVDYVSEYLLDDYVLLISEDGANLKSRVSPIAFTASGKMWVNNHAHILKFENNETHKLVELYINATDLSEFITGQAQPKLSQQNLNRIRIPSPDLNTQKQIVQQIEQLEAEIAALQKQLDQIPKQKEMILKKYLE